MSHGGDIFVISDLHMGDEGQRDNFSFENPGREEQLEKFLKYVQDEKGEIIILGDLFEFWQASIACVLMKRKNWLDRFAGMNATYIVGNHDIDLQAFIKDDGSVACEFLGHRFFNNMEKGPVQRTIGDKKFVFMHGHEVDSFNSGESPSWGRILAIFAGIFEEKNGGPMLSSGESVEEELAKFGEWALRVWHYFAKKKVKKNINTEVTTRNPKNELTPAQNPSRASEMLEKYREYSRENKCDIIVAGHTHQPGHYDDWYYNSGCWVKEVNNFIRITGNGEIGVWQWIDGKAVEDNINLASGKGKGNISIKEIPARQKYAKKGATRS